MTRFEAGQELKARSVGDSDCVFRATVISRTDKTVRIQMASETEINRCKIHTYHDGSEFIYPLGQYSMAPIFKAPEAVKSNVTYLRR